MRRVRSAREWAANARRLFSMSKPSLMGLGRCVGATTSTSTGTTISDIKLMSWRREHLHG
jgi:hypothetical protein